MKESAGTFSSKDGTSLAVRRWQPEGEAHAHVYLLHGFGEHAGRYGQLARKLTAAGCMLTALDQRGHGTSEGPRAVVPGPHALAEDWLHFLADEQAEQLPRVLMGHSMGGPVAAQVALARPGEFAGLVLSSPYLQPAKPPPAALVAALGLISKVLPGLPVQGRLSSAELSHQPEEAAAYDADPLIHHGGVSARTAHSLLGAGRDVLDRAPQLDLPLLILHGARDSIAGIEGSRQLLAAAGTRDKRIIEFADARHEVMNDSDREQFYSELLDWLAYRLLGTALEDD